MEINSQLTVNVTYATAKKQYYCRGCEKPLKQQIHRPWFVKNVLFFLPLRKYICSNCVKEQYVIVKK